MKPVFKAFLLFVAVSFTACNNKPIDEIKGFDYGKVENNLYTNKFFDIKINVPQGWNVQTQAENKALLAEGTELAAGDNESMKKVLKASEVNSASLLTVFKHDPLKEPVEQYNSNYMLVAENLKNIPGIETGADYLEQNKKLMEVSQVQFSHIDSEFKKRDINGMEFYVMNATMQYSGVAIKQVYMATVKDNFALGVIYSYIDEAQKAELEKVIGSLDNLRR